MSGKKILITGAAGFIGSHLADTLIARGDEVVGLDSFDAHYERSIKIDNIASALGSPRYTFVEGDIRDEVMLNEMFGVGRFDAVVHLAARAGVRHSILEPATFADINVFGTTLLLEASRKFDVPHFVFASSSSVYGASSTPPFSESQVADRPSSPYAATKRAGELTCHSYHHLYGITTSCLRFFTVYGPRQRPEMAIHKFTRQIHEGKTVDVYGDGGSRRDYTYIDDIIGGVVAALDRPNGYRIYNLGTTDTTYLRDLVVKIADRLGKELRANHVEDQLGDVPFTHADISLAAKELDYSPTTSIGDGLDSFIPWFLASHKRQLVGAPDPRDAVALATSASEESIAV